MPHTRATRLTAGAPAAIASLEVCGAGAVESVALHLQCSPQHLTLGRIRYAHWRLGKPLIDSQPDPASTAAEQVVVCRVAEDRIEIHCHGGRAVSQAIMADLQRSGCSLQWAEGWQGDQSCALARAAQVDLLLATTDRTAAILLDQMQGSLRRAGEALLLELESQHVARGLRRLEELLRWSRLGMHLTTPWKVVLAGPPNVGKSSLMNALVGSRQAIVHHEPGTTRDWLEARGAIDGWPVAFSDTAGVRPTSDPIEQTGVERSLDRWRQADLAVLVVDAKVGWSKQHQQLLDSSNATTLVVWNKADLVGQSPEISRLHHAQRPIDCLLASTVGAPGVSELLAAISANLVPDVPAVGTAVPFRTEQIAALRECQRLVIEQQLAAAAHSLRAWLDG